MDSVRKGQKLVKDAYKAGRYKDVPEGFRGGPELCENICVSDLKCKAWRFDTKDGSCRNTNNILDNFLIEKEGEVFGEVDFVPEYNYLRIVLLLLIMSLVLYTVWHFYFSCSMFF